jgi:hypothetical protein
MRHDKENSPRNFGCPESGETCTDPRCTKDRCCEDNRLQAAINREAAAKETRIKIAKVWEIIRPIIRAGNSN